MLKVLITVDVEVWPRQWNLERDSFDRDFRRYIYGPTRHGDYALPVQLELLDRYGLQAVFLVESLFACEVGIARLAEIVDLVQDAGQDVQLHLHPEWIGHMSKSVLPGRKARRMRDYSLEDQVVLLRHGLENLSQAGARQVNAFRAGGYGANRDTLRALAQCGIAFDTSYNPCILGDSSGISDTGPMLRPTMVEGVMEFPVGCFQDWPGHLRHTQLGACSFAELRAMLTAAWKQGQEYFVIVSHGFELLNLDKNRRDGIASRRFERLLAFLAANRDRFEAVTFGGMDAAGVVPGSAGGVLKSSPARTGLRYIEQAMRRVYQ